MTAELEPPAASAVDRSVTRPVLVYGSLPPHGRDLDLFVREPELQALRDALPRVGFAAVGGTWLRVTPDGPQVVDLRPERGWGLPPAEVDALFTEARPVPGYQHLVRPSPAHALLVLARRVAGGDGTLDGPRRERLEQAQAEDPGAWEQAERRAPAWGAVTALRVLRAAADGRPAPRAERAQALAERHLRAGAPAVVARLKGRRGSSARPPRGRVVALSGLDGAGKSTQAAALVAALEANGHPAVAQWTRLSYDPVLERLGGAAKRVVRRLPSRGRPAPRPAAALDVHPSRVRTPEQQLRQSSPAMTAVWAAVVAVSNGVTQRRRTREHLREGRTVVCDRWTLDSAVHLRYRYGESRRFRVQVALIRLLSPRPVRTFFLHVPAEAAYARKDDHFDVEQLRRHERLYVEEHPRHGAHRLDGQRPSTDLSTEIAASVLGALRQQRGLLRRLR